MDAGSHYWPNRYGQQGIGINPASLRAVFKRGKHLRPNTAFSSSKARAAGHRLATTQPGTVRVPIFMIVILHSPSYCKDSLPAWKYPSGGPSACVASGWVATSDAWRSQASSLWTRNLACACLAENRPAGRKGFSPIHPLSLVRQAQPFQDGPAAEGDDQGVEAGDQRAAGDSPAHAEAVGGPAERERAQRREADHADGEQAHHPAAHLVGGGLLQKRQHGRGEDGGAKAHDEEERDSAGQPGGGAEGDEGRAEAEPAADGQPAFVP